jgi:CIC family chloride channel protein
MLNSTIETRDKLLLSRLDLHELVETNFAAVDVNASLKDLTKQIASSTRNMFPVIDQNHKLVGLVHLDQIRSIMFDQSKYDTTTVKELMVKPSAVVELNENIYEVLAKFDSTGQWNLPVVENDCYMGFLSKSTILTRYRRELMNAS